MFRFEVFHDESSLFLLRLGEINTPTDMSNSKFKKFSLLLFQVLFYIFQSRPECTLRCTYVRPLSWHVAAKVNRHALVSFLPRIYSFAIFFFFYDPDRQLTAEPDSLKGKKGKKRVNLLTAAVMYIEYTHHHDNNDIIAPVTWGGDFPAFGNERRRLHGGCITSAFGCAATWASSWNCPFYRDDMRYYVRRPFLFFPDKKNLMEITACTCRNFLGLFFLFQFPASAAGHQQPSPRAACCTYSTGWPLMIPADDVILFFLLPATASGKRKRIVSVVHPDVFIFLSLWGTLINIKGETPSYHDKPPIFATVHSRKCPCVAPASFYDYLRLPSRQAQFFFSFYLDSFSTFIYIHTSSDYITLIK